LPSFAPSLLKGLAWREFADYVTPAVFDVVSPRALASTATSFLRAQVDAGGASRARAERALALRAHGLPVVLVDAVDGQLPTGEAERRRRGDTMLRLYFHQLLVGSVALLDLGPGRFGGDPLGWSPTWARHTWSPEFQGAIRDLYAGFYGGDPVRFDHALDLLGLRPAREVFLGHFGGDQRAVRFSLPHFRTTFHAAFVACRDGKTQIHVDFLPMGLMLASLYAHLEALNVPLDVRAAWLDVSSPDET
jgi:hypothetical protein